MQRLYDGIETATLAMGEPFSLLIRAVALEGLRRVSFVVGIDNRKGDRITTAASEETGNLYAYEEGEEIELIAHFGDLILNAGRYDITLSARTLRTGLDLVRPAIGSVDISLDLGQKRPFDTAVAYSGCVFGAISHAECPARAYRIIKKLAASFEVVLSTVEQRDHFNLSLGTSRSEFFEIGFHGVFFVNRKHGHLFIENRATLGTSSEP